MASLQFQSLSQDDWLIRQRAHQLLYPKQEFETQAVITETRRRSRFITPVFWSMFVLMSISSILYWAMPLSPVIAGLSFVCFTAFGASTIAQIWAENRISQSSSIWLDTFKKPSQGASLEVAKVALFMAKAGKLLSAFAYPASVLMLGLCDVELVFGLALPAAFLPAALGLFVGSAVVGTMCHLLMPRLAYRQAWLEDHYSASASAVEAPSVVNRFWGTIMNKLSHGFNSVFRPGMEGPGHKAGYARVDADQDRYVLPREEYYSREHQRPSFLNGQAARPQQEGLEVRERQHEMGAAL